MRSCVLSSATCLFSIIFFVAAQASPPDGYTGYNYTLTGDPESATYDTLSTPANVSTTDPPPDVYLNASVSVGEIDILVANLSAKINLDAQVLSLLQFNAGVDVSIDRVSLIIQNVSAKVLLEARLANVVEMIGDVLDSIDLNPIIATLGNDVGQILNTTTSAVGDLTSGLSKRESFLLSEGIIYSINNYQGDTHTNRILEQNGDLVDQSLDNDGRVSGQKVVGSYATDMTFDGHESRVTRNGQEVTAKQYTYTAITGLSVVADIFFDASGSVVGTQIISEGYGGGISTLSSQ